LDIVPVEEVIIDELGAVILSSIVVGITLVADVSYPRFIASVERVPLAKLLIFYEFRETDALGS
jgi:hypothetical protein